MSRKRFTLVGIIFLCFNMAPLSLASTKVSRHQVIEIELKQKLGGSTPEFSLFDQIEESEFSNKEAQSILIEATAQVPSKRGMPTSALNLDVWVAKEKVGTLSFEVSTTSSKPIIKQLKIARALDKQTAPLVLRNHGVPLTLHRISILY